MDTRAGRPDQRDLELHVRTCTFCRTPILWAKTEESGQAEWLPLDADPAAYGTVLVRKDPADPRRAICRTYRGRAQRDAMREAGIVFHVPHALSCPQSEAYLRGPKSLRPTPSATVVPAPRQAPEAETGLW